MEEEVSRVKTLEETDAHCPRCGGAMVFDPDGGVLSCPYCDFRQAVPRDGAQGSADVLQELSFEEAEEKGNCDWGQEKKAVSCQACGAEILYDALTVSDVCPYCGSNHVMEARDEHTLAPNGVVPFQVTREQAAGHFTRWIKKKIFAPGAVRKNARLEAIRGLYLPYWTFDTQAISTYFAEYGRDRHVKAKDGKEKTVTDWFRTNGVYCEAFDDELVAASDRYDRKIMAAIEPFDCAKGTGYRPEYLSGYGAERYTLGLADGWKTAQERLRIRLQNAVENKVRREKHADHVRNVQLYTNFSKITYKYMMLPVWMSGFTYRGKLYQFMVNGQTGRVGGRHPVAAWKVALAVAAVLALLGLLFYLYIR